MELDTPSNVLECENHAILSEIRNKKSVQSTPDNTTGRMRISIGIKLLLISGLALGFRIEDLFGQKKFSYDQPAARLTPPQYPSERPDGQCDILVPAFIATFIASSVTNLLFPLVGLRTTRKEIGRNIVYLTSPSSYHKNQRIM